MPTKYNAQKANHVRRYGAKRDFSKPTSWTTAMQELEQLLHDLENRHAEKLSMGDTDGAAKVWEKMELVKSSIANKKQQGK